jgi:hypothetical protein
MAADLLDLSPDATALRAEALRNACIQAAFFAGGTGPSPGERFATIDLTRAETSAVSAGLGPTEMPDARADRMSALWRRLAEVVLRLDEARSGGSAGERGRGAGARGLDVAERRLRGVGALPHEDGAAAEGWEREDLRLELMRAAVECGADLDLAASRYLILDREAGIPAAEFEELNLLGYGASADRLEAAIASRRGELDRLGRVPSGGNR